MCIRDREYAEKHGNYEKGDGTDAYGYYLNPNAEWDWFQIGGRWPNRFLVKSNCCTVFSGELSFFLKGEPDVEAPDGYCWVTGARKKDIAWDVMKALFIQREREIYLQCEKLSLIHISTWPGRWVSSQRIVGRLSMRRCGPSSPPIPTGL